MRIKYLDRTWYYEPKYQLDDFIRVNELENYDTPKLIKIMVKLYEILMEENYL